jgi:plastocyanin/predicted small lipoprotein YifL
VADSIFVKIRNGGKGMKSRFVTFAAVGALAFLAACGSKEPSAPAEQPKASAPTAAVTVDPATAGAVAGSVKLDGTAPKPKRIRMDAEPSCAAKHASGAFDEEFVVGDGGAFANVVVYVKEGLKGDFPTSKESVELDQVGCLYTPHVIAVQTNQNVQVKNTDPTTHNIHPTPSANREWNESQPQGSAPLQKTFAREELAIPVKCNVHPWMKSYIAVFKHPYFKVTGKDGKFEIKNLPPGEYTLEAWHEKLGASAPQKVTIGAKETKTVDFVFKAGA